MKENPYAPPQHYAEAVKSLGFQKIVYAAIFIFGALHLYVWTVAACLAALELATDRDFELSTAAWLLGPTLVLPLAWFFVWRRVWQGRPRYQVAAAVGAPALPIFCMIQWDFALNTATFVLLLICAIISLSVVSYQRALEKRVTGRRRVM